MLLVSDVVEKLGRPLTPSETGRVQSDIDDAVALAEDRGLVSEPMSPSQRAVLRRVVVRAFRNPEGVRQESLGSRSVSYADDAKPGVYFTAQDIADMRGRRSGVYSVRLTTPADGRP
jgi:hypothetical protein